MAHCTNLNCRRPIQAGFAFCPFCGADNRPPNERAAVKCAGHQTVEGGWACVLCGASLDENGEALRGPVYRLLGFALVLAGLGVAFALVWIPCFLLRTMGLLTISLGVVGVSAGIYMVMHGLRRMRGVATDFDPDEMLDPF